MTEKKTETFTVPPEKVTLNATESESLNVIPHCKMTVCEDPVTGDIVLAYEKGCPKGYIEKVAGKIAVKGLRLQEDQDEHSSEKNKTQP